MLFEVVAFSFAHEFFESNHYHDLNNDYPQLVIEAYKEEDTLCTSEEDEKGQSILFNLV